MLFGRTSHSEGHFLNLFSVGHGNGIWNGTARVIVTHEGQNTGLGDWTCSKDARGRCVHISAARTKLREWLLRESEEGGEEDGDEADAIDALDIREWDGVE